ncbi:MAG TPA: STT3 domain-containing protein [Myxococcota bacterium]|nr:STT3 domain-containing protein [Myxococcota bacterium]
MNRLPRKRGTAALPWLALFALAVAVRSLLYPFVFTDAGIEIPAGADQFYHLRRIWFTVVNFPDALDFDRYINYPHGARPQWTPLFDWSVAALARLLVGAEHQGRVEAVAVWVAPFLGGLTVVAAARLARRHFGSLAGWVSGLLLVVLPAHTMISGLAAVDHHVANALMAVLLVGAAMRVAGPAEGARWTAGIALTSVVIAATLLLWVGSLVEVVVVQLVLVGQLLLAPERSVARTRARGLAVLHALSAIWLAPFCFRQEWVEQGPVSPLALTAFQPLWFGSGALALTFVAVLWRWHALGASRPRRAGTALALGAGGLAVAFFAIPELAGALGNAAGWFQADPFLERIWEIQPLLFQAGRFDASLAHAEYSYLFWAYPLAAAWLVAKAIRERRAEWMLLALWSIAMLVAALMQRRFNELASPGFALVLGPALAEAWCAARAHLAPARRRQAALAACLLAVVPLWPSLREQGRSADASMRRLRGLPLPELEGAGLRRSDVLKRVARWLHAASPPTRGWLDARLEPEYGVLSAWDDGHLLRYYAERPFVEDNFGPFVGRAGFDAAREYYASRDEDAAVEIARRCNARYVVATAKGSGQHGTTEAMAQRLTPKLRPAGGLTLPTPALDRHRLVFVAEDAGRARASGQRPEIAAVYEIVKGARVHGGAAPGAAIQFDLRLELPDGSALFWIAGATADTNGRYALRLPYPTQPGDGSAVRSDESYRVRVEGREARLAISAADVTLGREVAGPSFAP